MTSSPSIVIEPLPPSKLGQREYWNQFYDSEYQNFLESNDPENGTEWFSEVNARSRIVKHLLRTLSLPLSSSILDLGTGNGHLLFALAEAGFCGNLVGVDYSDTSVQLAKSLVEAEQPQQDELKNCSFFQYDILKNEPGSWFPEGGFDVVLDKGTFDAVSLSSDVDPSTGKRIFESYAGRIIPLIKKGGRFLVTSCNWTEAELRAWFESEILTFESRIDYATFRFGGKTGQAVCSICFIRSK